MNWGHWFMLNENTPWIDEWGIYRIRLVGAAGIPVALPRLGAVDATGILYIGRSGYSTAKSDRSLGQRLWEFYSHGSHSGAGSWWQTKAALDRLNRWPGSTLAASVVKLHDTHIDQAECDAMRTYFSQFAELPPCNSAFPGKWSTYR